eukprot:8581239-Alexandrium_andersonii.AAC.1
MGWVWAPGRVRVGCDCGAPGRPRLERCASRRLRGGACERGRLERHRRRGPGQIHLDPPHSYARCAGRAGMG